ncbi:MAG TPA: deoxyribodipyrimidine photo-lyase, partial [Flavobacterium sp.]
MNIFWFRRDLRLIDNAGLYHALSAGNVLPIFIFDTNILSELPRDDARVAFIHLQLSGINDRLKSIDRSVATFYGDPEKVFAELLASHQIENVYTNEDYEPYAIARDNKIREILKSKNVGFQLFKDHVIFAKDEIVKSDGTPYVVFTPFSRRWKEKLVEHKSASFPSEALIGNIYSHNFSFPTLAQLQFNQPNLQVDQYNLSHNLILTYEKTRNFPALAETSGLSPHLRLGTISIRKVLQMAVTNETFLNELIWREFFIQILWHFPFTVNKSFRPKYDNIKWRNNEDEFLKWCNGQTGYPIVDAGMRQLNATGLMHNRVRMITASFLCKHLLIDWHWGEAYFAMKLLDYEQASN